MRPTQLAPAVDEGYRAAIELLYRSLSPAGYVASPADPHYAAIWTRDASITCVGVSVVGDSGLLAGARDTLATIASHQNELGMVANAFWPANGYWDWGESGCTDDQTWFIIAAEKYYAATRDTPFIRDLWPALQKCIQWLRYQDCTNIGLIDSPEAGDWMDSSLNRCGKVLHNNVLYLRATEAMHRLARALGSTSAAANPDHIRWAINTLFWPQRGADYTELLRQRVAYDKPHVQFPHPASLAGFTAAAREREYYLAHVSFGTFADTCDVLANVLAILCDAANPEQTSRILDHLASRGAAHPYPAKSWLKPVEEADNPWGLLKPVADQTQDPRWRNPPHCYHNGGIWPFIGGYYVMAQLKAGRQEEAIRTLNNLAEANALSASGVHEAHRWGFHEWLHGITGEPRGAPDQVWSAATFVMAYHALRDGAHF